MAKYSKYSWLIPDIFRYNPRNHCWPAIWKAIKAIMVFTLLLTAIEAPLVYEIKNALLLTRGKYALVVCVIAIINSLLLRRYVLILRKRNKYEHGEPRWACHMFIWMASLAFIITGNEIEHDARVGVYHSQTLDGIKFNEAEYFYIDSLPQLDIAHYATNTKHWTHTGRRDFSTTHYYTGCYVAPFRGFGDVFNVVEYEYSQSAKISSFKQKEEEIYENFQKEFDEMCDGIKPTVNSHLFKILPHESESYYYIAIDNAYLRDTIYHGITYSYRAVALTPVKNDQMPRWTDKLPLVFIFMAIYFLILLLVYTGSKTVPFPEDE